YEAIDPVRFIGNHSSGKMGYAIAEAAAGLGASVILISGPTHLQLKHNLIEVIRVTSAAQMLDAVQANFDKVDIAIAAAAVADYRPAQVADQKIKKKEASMSIALEPTTDILAYMGKTKGKQFLVG
ncbi:MAG TPA: phosphopantothenoylcysteine decarboxylase, partial [Leeuwenhoekiella sp.]|nr:phosphopantothenoylcysteine decarboxylase [Leeuwenhoekiella sp.]